MYKNCYLYHLLNVFLLHCNREQADLHVYLPPCFMHSHTHTFMQSPLGKNTHKVHASLKLPSQHSSLTAFGCHEDDEVRGLGVEFDPDWQRQRWHNLYQSTSLRLDSLCLSVCVCVCVCVCVWECVCVCVCEREKSRQTVFQCECEWFSVALLLRMPVCVYVWVCVQGIS